MGCVCCKFPSSLSDGGKKIKRMRRKNATTDEFSEVIPILSHDFKLECVALTRRGYFPDTPNKDNQDCFCIKTSIQGNLAAGGRFFCLEWNEGRGVDGAVASIGNAPLLFSF
ncbi:unnamed protein product [Lactuca saligna]|uniref:Uncharacterized protein n=1 Tax=Lactuca saligna TaxID=75948 RepID=A0AA35V2U4_LACSI|nr:unnamed protein product [Lactuca saligna]